MDRARFGCGTADSLKRADAAGTKISSANLRATATKNAPEIETLFELSPAFQPCKPDSKSISAHFP
jgi:hypothetical protein